MTEETATEETQIEETATEEVTAEEAPVVPKVNKNQLKKEIREAVDGVEVADGQPPLFREKVGWEEDEETKAITGYVILHNAEDEDAVQKLMEIAEADGFTVYLQEWTEESKRGKWEAKKDGKTTKRVNSAFKGNSIFVSEDLIGEDGEIKNPRREGTHGYNAFEILKAHLKENGTDDGMPYETYVEKGGASNHLKWDIEHAFVEIKPTTSEENAEAA